MVYTVNSEHPGIHKKTLSQKINNNKTIINIAKKMKYWHMVEGHGKEVFTSWLLGVILDPNTRRYYLSEISQALRDINV